jgi:hypothetical protein
MNDSGYEARIAFCQLFLAGFANTLSPCMYPAASPAKTRPLPGRNFPADPCSGVPLNRFVRVVSAVVLLAPFSIAGDLPDAPSSTLAVVAASSITTAAPVFVPKTVKLVETRIIDKKFIFLAIVSTGSTFADSYTTLFARQNWLAKKQNVCNVESESPYLYGRHPTVPRAYLVASGKSVGSAAAAYYLRKRHLKWWSLPLMVNAALSLQGVTQNLKTCN